MTRDIRPIATFGEDAATDADEDCWLLLGDVTQAILNRAAPSRGDRSGEVVVAFPRRTHQGGGD